MIQYVFFLFDFVSVNELNETDKLNLTGSKTNDNKHNKTKQGNAAFSPLRTACEKGQCTIVQCLIERGAKINVLDKDGLAHYL